MSDETGHKEYEPTERRLDEARRKGEIPLGRDLLAAAAYGGFLVALIATPASVLTIGGTGAVLLEQSDRIAAELNTGATTLLGSLGRIVLSSTILWFALPAIVVVLTLIAQRGLVFAPTRLAPKLSRISPIAGAKRKFGRSGLFEFAKSAVKLIAVSAILGLFLSARIDTILHSLHLAPVQIAGLFGRILLQFLALVLLLQLVIGAIDLLWQHVDHRRRHRMSRKDMTDETKQSEGDPHVRAQRRQRAREIAANRMLADVPLADVVIVNPTHYAVALKWNRQAGGAPVCVAKGVDGIAASIRRIAAESGVPLRHDPPTARAIHASVEIGEEIRPEHYRAVAAAIRFAQTLRQRAKARGTFRRGPR